MASRQNPDSRRIGRKDGRVARKPRRTASWPAFARPSWADRSHIPRCFPRREGSARETLTRTEVLSSSEKFPRPMLCMHFFTNRTDQYGETCWWPLVGNLKVPPTFGVMPCVCDIRLIRESDVVSLDVARFMQERRLPSVLVVGFPIVGW